MNKIRKRSEVCVMEYIDILIGIGLVISLLFLLFTSSTRKRIRTEILFTKKYKSYKRFLIIIIPCFVLVTAATIWELINDVGESTFIMLRPFVFSTWFFVPYKFVITKDGFYNVNRFGGSTLICIPEQYKNCSRNKKGFLVIEYLNNANQITSVCLNDRFFEEEIMDLEQFQRTEG